ncbi:MAG TPA: hypothetical protein ENH34_06380 [Phycisphaerales bacterium]|nr:hypothetical protein [Phycisphaerales bacterium]
MRKQKDILNEAVNALKDAPVTTGPPQETVDAVLQKLTTAGEESHKLSIRKRIRITERIRAMKRFTKIAAAAVIVMAVVLSITFLDKLVTPAYSIEQTIQANHTVRYLHIKDFKTDEDEPREFWLEFDESGQVENVRMHLPEWAGGGDGPKVIVWKENKAKVWIKKKNVLVTIRDKTIAAHMLKLVEECDPRLAVQRLYEREVQSKVKIEIAEPSDKSEPIVITATYLPGSSTPGKRGVLFVDQATKLVTAIELYQLKDGEYQYLGLMEFYDYNQPIAPEMFTLDNLPADIMRVDQTIQVVGLAQGNLSNEEIATEVARQFFKALIVKDYDKAGKLLEGIPGKRMEQMFGNIKVLRIVSIGPVAPHPKPETKGVVVPCTVEIEKNGVISEWKLNRLGVRQVYNQPGRWTIFGGI